MSVFIDGRNPSAGSLGLALDSVLMQQTDFAIEVAVIANEPQLISNWRGDVEVKVESPSNWEPRADYIAFMDAADLWLVDYKLRRQVELLAASPDAVGCCHCSMVLFEQGMHPGRDTPSANDSILELEDVLSTWSLVPRSTLMARGDAVASVLGHEVWGADSWLLLVRLLIEGGVGIWEPDRMTAVRLNNRGTPRIAELRERLDTFDRLERLVPSRSLDALTDGRANAQALIAVERSIAPGEPGVLVLTGGDEQLLDLGPRQGFHFPRDRDGYHAGYNPADSGEAIAALEREKTKGASHLVIPSATHWWLSYYSEFADHLDSHGRCLWSDESAVVYQIGPTSA